jgi:hypothetical protein
MYKINNDCIKNWGKTGSHHIPIAINISCPHCKDKVTFTIQVINSSSIKNLLSFALHADCPSCNAKTRFFLVNPAKSEDNEDNHGGIYMYPPPSFKTEMIDSDKIPGKLQKAYSETLKTYNANLLPSAAVNTRRVLEGICKLNLKKEDHTNLAQMLTKLPDNINLSETLKKLLDTIKDHGNIGAHFDLEVEDEISNEDAEMAIQLLEGLLELVYILPGRVAELKQKVSKKNR